MVKLNLLLSQSTDAPGFLECLNGLSPTGTYLLYSQPAALGRSFVSKLLRFAHERHRRSLRAGNSGSSTTPAKSERPIQNESKLKG